MPTMIAPIAPPVRPSFPSGAGVVPVRFVVSTHVLESLSRKKPILHVAQLEAPSFGQSVGSVEAIPCRQSHWFISQYFTVRVMLRDVLFPSGRTAVSFSRWNPVLQDLQFNPP